MSGRFDSMLATAMRLGTGDAFAQAASWRQIVDIVAQAGPALDGDTREAAFHQLAELRDHVPAADRRMAAASLAGRSSRHCLRATCPVSRPRFWRGQNSTRTGGNRRSR